MSPRTKIKPRPEDCKNYGWVANGVMTVGKLRAELAKYDDGIPLQVRGQYGKYFIDEIKLDGDGWLVLGRG